MTYPWVDDPGRGEPESRYPWMDDPDAGVEAPPAYQPGGERRVQLLRRIDPWSVLKVSLVMYLCFVVVTLLVGAGVWLLGRQIGFVGGIETFIEDLYFPGTFEFKDGEILIISTIVGPILAVLAALVTTAGVVVYNLVARLTGGIEVTVKESG